MGKIKPYYNIDDLKVTYLFIPKCGATSMNVALKYSEFQRSDIAEYESFCILRDPKDRIMSGYSEIRKRGHFNGSINQMLQFIESNGFWNSHIKPQLFFFNKVDRVYLFPDAFEKISRWIGIDIGHHNHTEPFDRWDEDSERLFNRIYADEVGFFQDIKSSGNVF